MKKRIRYPSRKSDDPAERVLAYFVDRVRGAKRGKGDFKITSEIIDFLESTPGWSWGDTDVNMNNCIALRSWMGVNGGRVPSQKSKDLEERQLGTFVARMRMAKRGSGKYKITSDHIEYLESTPGWRWGAEDVNMNNCVTLRSWMSDNGDQLPSAKSKDLEEQRLGVFAVHIRSTKRGKGGHKITSDHIKYLESIPGWRWNPRKKK